MINRFKFKYYYQHEETGYIVSKVIDLLDFENHIDLRLPRYNIIARCQCTGLKDINGKEIFDGDILIFDGDILSYRTEKVICEWNEDMFHLKSSKYNLSPGNYRLAVLNNKIKIIGNIHENPELLEECEG